jgi:beta-galactosidase
MGNTAEFGFWADAVHASRPDTPIAVSEYGAGAGLSQHEEPPVRPTPAGLFHPEEYQTLLHEQTWTQMAARPFLWGKFVWNMFDFAVDTRNEGDTPGRNDKGLVSYDRQTRKDAFYWYQANWTTEPMVHINGRRFNPRNTETVDVKVYSNASMVSLRLNGVEQGSAQRVDGHQYLWLALPLALGENVLEAYVVGSADGLLAQDSLVWTRQ